jgi:hypothetical protein
MELILKSLQGEKVIEIKEIVYTIGHTISKTSDF